MIIVATDANCKGLNQRTRELDRPNAPAPIIAAIPDPHIERWLLLDGAAFRTVFGRGCNAPDQKFSRNLYKQQLIKAVYDADITPSIGVLSLPKTSLTKWTLTAPCVPTAHSADS